MAFADGRRRRSLLVFVAGLCLPAASSCPCSREGGSVQLAAGRHISARARVRASAEHSSDTAFQKLQLSDGAPCRVRARLRYDGAAFHGVQKNIRTQDGAELRTITSTLERALWPVLGQEVKLRVAGRTDAGVSALGQVVAFDATAARSSRDEPAIWVNGSSSIDLMSLMVRFNARLPSDLQVTDLEAVAATFDVVRDCRWKRYRYRLPACCPDDLGDEDGRRLLQMVATHSARAARQREAEAAEAKAAEGIEDGPDGLWPPPPPPRHRRASRAERRARRATRLAIVDVDAMSTAAALLEGTHDFRAFQAGGGDAKGTVRTLFRCAIEPRTADLHHDATAHAASVSPCADAPPDPSAAYDIVVEGDGFLYKMVRLIAGTLVGVGMGLLPTEAVVEALGTPHARSDSGLAPDELRRRGVVVGPTLPPLPLSLEHVEYETDHPAAEMHGVQTGAVRGA